MKKFIEEFKKFALKGNVMDLAIGVIIGAAFQNIVSALTNDFITPLIAAITGKTDENGGVVIGGQFTINGATFNYGDFISSIINFLIMALILFLLIKIIRKLYHLNAKKKTIFTKKRIIVRFAPKNRRFFRQNRQPCPPPYIKNVNLFDGAYIDFETHLV